MYVQGESLKTYAVFRSKASQLPDHGLGEIAMRYCILLAAGMLAGCASGNTVQTSRDTAIVQASAAPVCGGIGAARVAQKQAAIATLRAGYDRYMIVGASAANNVRYVQTPGTYQTNGSISGGGMISATTTYTPGAPMPVGTHDAAFAVQMFREGDPRGARAISARSVLGPNWAQQMQKQTVTC